MSVEDDEPITLPSVAAIHETAKALLVVIDGLKVWVPKSQIHDDSEVYASGHTGDLVVTAWWAGENGYA